MGRDTKGVSCKISVLYLTNNDNALELYLWLKERCNIERCSEALTLDKVRKLEPDLIISYNYKYIIKEDIIRYMGSRIINLHISYLPWNRGSDPNFWSFVEDTPKGVTIHQISAGLDKGAILYQEECRLDAKKETFVTSYEKLHKKIVVLFQSHWEEICAGSYTAYKQIGKGSYHTRKDLEELRERCPFQWSDNIADFLRRYGMG